MQRTSPLVLAVAAGLLIVPLLVSPAAAQFAVVFSDSPDSTEWAASWGTASGGSAIELVNVSHVPVQTAPAFLGANALRLRWTAAAGGSWDLTVATANWVAFSTAPYDTLVFAVWSAGGLAPAELPRVFLEDQNNVRTPAHALSALVAAVPAAAWTRVAVPMALFRANPGGADLTRINKVFFSQSATMSPGIQRTLLVDEIRFVAAGLPPPAAGSAEALGFERHVEVRWDPGAMSGVDRVALERLEGAGWTRIGDAPAADGACMDWRGARDVAGEYRVLGIGPDLRASAPSASVTAATRALADAEWLDMTAEAAFRYFWLHAHPVSGLARERYGSGEVCATGGTGMGIMATVVAAERGWIPRAAAVARIRRIAEFYDSGTRLFHGAFSHWVNGTTGAPIPFDAPDDSTGDIVETGYLMQGLLTARQYFDGATPDEAGLREIATRVWERVDWNAYRPVPPGTAIYWLWSPVHGFSASFPLAGWNEAMIVYVLAAASPTHPIPASCYAQGWARGGAMVNGRSFYGLTLWVGPDWGGGLYLNQYSFMSLDPRFKRDAYANYEHQCRNAALIDRLYCAANPLGHAGYSADVWGLTASDDPWGYSNRGPYSNDNGTLAPTAALGMMPFTYSHSLAALQAMYRQYGERLWGPFGFRDAFNPGRGWFASSYIAIDQGPIVVMIENARTQLVWNCFMRNPEIAPALAALGFVADSNAVSGVSGTGDGPVTLAAASPNPFERETSLSYALPSARAVEVDVLDAQGRRVATLFQGRADAGRSTVAWNGRDDAGRRAPAGLYFVRLRAGESVALRRVVRLR